MRTLDRAFILAGVISLAVLIGISSCGDNGKEEQIEAKKTLEATIERDAWKVTYFYDGRDQTAYFNGTTIEFRNDGGIVANWNNVIVKGIWTAVDARNGELRINILFDEQMRFEGLEQEWVVVKTTDSKITLEDVAGAGELLTLEKV